MDDRVQGEVMVDGRAIKITESLGRLDLDNLKGEIREIGSTAVWWGILTANAKRRANDTKLSVEIIKAQLGREKRQSFEARGIKITERAIEEEMVLDPRYREVMEAYHQAQETADTVESTKYAIVGKSQNLAALAPMIAQEARADLPDPFQQPTTGTRKRSL